MIEELVRDLATGFEGHFTRALFISGALALLTTAIVGFAWWRGKRWMTNRGSGPLGAGSHSALFSRDASPPGGSPGDSPLGGGTSDSSPGDHDPRADEQPGARLIREAAARAAGLRDAWDRSYREARGADAAPPATPTSPASASTLDVLIAELLREQRQTNALLRQIAEQLEKPR